MTSAAGRAASHVSLRPRLVTWSLRAAVLSMLVVTAAGCAKARAAGVPEAPPLVVPPPPPRVLVPVPEEEPLAANPAAPDTTAASVPRIQPAQQRPARRTPPSEPDAGAKAPAAAASAPAASNEPREVRTTPSTREVTDQQQRIQALLTGVDRALGKVDYKQLTPEGRENYENAKRWAKDAADALRDRYYLRAQDAADKAFKIADALLKNIR